MGTKGNYYRNNGEPRKGCEKMKLQIPILGVIVVVLAGVVGCAQYRIVADERNPSEGELSESVCGWSCDLEGGRKVRRVSQEQSIGAVSVHGSYWRAWGTVLTFGAWQPFEVAYEVNDDAPDGVK